MSSALLRTVPLQSSTLLNVAYHDRMSVLVLQFRNGARYRYQDVPNRIYRELLDATSKGAFFNQHIRGFFAYVRLNQEPNKDLSETK